MAIHRRLAIAMAGASSMLACGARSSLTVDREDAGSGGAPLAPGPPCTLRVAVAPRRVFPESSADSESVFSSFTATHEGDQACFLSFLKVEGAATFSLHQRCMHGFGTFDLGTDVIMGGPMQDHSLVPPADLLVAPGATTGFALYYGHTGSHVFGASVAPGSSAMPSSPVGEVQTFSALGAPGPYGHFVVAPVNGAAFLGDDLIHADGSVLGPSELICPPESPLTLKIAHLGASNLVVSASWGAQAWDCKPGAHASVLDIAARSYAGDISAGGAGRVDLGDPIRDVAVTRFGDHEAFAVVSTSGKVESLHAILIHENAKVEKTLHLGVAVPGFGVSAAAELGGALLVVQDAPRAAGEMSDVGLRVELVDPASGFVWTTLDVPLDAASVDSPSAPVIVTSPDHNEALLGFFAQPLGTGGRDYVARLACTPP